MQGLRMRLLRSLEKESAAEGAKSRTEKGGIAT